MIYLTFGVFLLNFLLGFLLMDLLWPNQNQSDVFLKASFGIGMGLGVSSILYFLYLLFFAGQSFFLYIELSLLMILILFLLRKRRFKCRFEGFSFHSVQVFIGIIAGVVLIASFLSIANYLAHRTRGDWDAWMIYNRTARFIYRNQEVWRESFSNQLDTMFHADYPLLLALNITSGWEILGRETAYVPMIQSFLFSIACVATLASALAFLKSFGQGSLGIILLWGTPFFVNEGGRQTADMPLAFFMLASVILISLYCVDRKPVLMALAGFSAGLAAWTKNEGVLFVLASGTALMINCFRDRSLKSLYLFIAGLMLPLGITLYFKYFLAPPSEFFRGDFSRILSSSLDLSRHKTIFSSFVNEFLFSSAGGLTVFSFMLLYWLFFHSRKEKKIIINTYGIVIILVQMVGYYAIYLISPYDLEWHLDFSIGRLLVHLFPTFLFLVLYTSQTPEDIFMTRPD